MSDGRSSAADYRDNDPFTTINLKPFVTLELTLTYGKGSYLIASGQAEYAGSLLRQNKEYVLSDHRSTAIFSWKGCVVEVSGNVRTRTTESSPFSLILKNHALLEVERHSADRSGSLGPRVMVIGESDVGKTTVVRYLLNYAVRMGRTPMFVSLDFKTGDVGGVPGTIGAVVVDKSSDDAGRFCDLKEPPLVYHMGRDHIESHRNLFYKLCDNLGRAVLPALERNPSVKSSGCIIDTPSCAEKFMPVIRAAEAFEVSHVIVVGSERVYNEAIRELPPFVAVTLLPALPCADRSGVTRRITADRASKKIELYFAAHKSKGDHKRPSSPGEEGALNVSVPQDAVKVIEVERDSRRTTALDIDTVKLSSSMEQKLLAVSTGSSSEEAATANILGYVAVSRVSRKDEEVRFKVPTGNSVPGRYLIAGDFSFEGGS